MKKGGYIYIMSNKNRTVLYIGVTAQLYWRVQEHKNGKGSDFTKMYNCVDLVYYECFTSIEEAIHREKQLKTFKRKWKDELILSFNKDLKDLTELVKDFV